MEAIPGICSFNAVLWRHNENDGVSNHQPHHCLLNLLDQRKYQSSASLAFVLRIHRWPVNSPHKWPVTRIMFRFDDVIMVIGNVMCLNRNRFGLRYHWSTRNSKCPVKCINMVSVNGITKLPRQKGTFCYVIQYVDDILRLKTVYMPSVSLYSCL